MPRGRCSSSAARLASGTSTRPGAPLQAARRELHEETNITSVSLLGETEGWLCYDIPTPLAGLAWRGRYRGQSQKWFAFRFEGEDEDVDITGHAPEFVRWRWAPPREVLSLVVDFKRPVYEAVFAEFGDLLTA